MKLVHWPLMGGLFVTFDASNEVGTLAVDGWAVCYIWCSEEGTGRAGARSRCPRIAVQCTNHRIAV